MLEMLPGIKNCEAHYLFAPFSDNNTFISYVGIIRWTGLIKIYIEDIAFGIIV